MNVTSPNGGAVRIRTAAKCDPADAVVDIDVSIRGVAGILTFMVDVQRRMVRITRPVRATKPPAPARQI